MKLWQLQLKKVMPLDEIVCIGWGQDSEEELLPLSDVFERYGDEIEVAFIRRIRKPKSDIDIIQIVLVA